METNMHGDDKTLVLLLVISQLQLVITTRVQGRWTQMEDAIGLLLADHSGDRPLHEHQ